MTRYAIDDMQTPGNYLKTETRKRFDAQWADTDAEYIVVSLEDSVWVNREGDVAVDCPGHHYDTHTEYDRGYTITRLIHRDDGWMNTRYIAERMLVDKYPQLARIDIYELQLDVDPVQVFTEQGGGWYFRQFVEKHIVQPIIDAGNAVPGKPCHAFREEIEASKEYREYYERYGEALEAYLRATEPGGAPKQ